MEDNCDFFLLLTEHQDDIKRCQRKVQKTIDCGLCEDCLPPSRGRCFKDFFRNPS